MFRIMHTRALVLFIGALLITAPAFSGTKEDLEQVQRNVLELQQQFWNLEKSIKANNDAISGVVNKLQDTTEQMRDSQASLNSKLDSILNQMQALNSKLDETNRHLKDLSLGNGSGHPTIPDINAPPGTTAPGNATIVNPAPPPAGNAPVGTVGEQQLFQTAMAQYTKGKFEQALRGFQDLLDQYPNSALADDAQYMIGESYYSMKEYVDAVTEYDKVLKKFPDSKNVPGAQLKKAFSLYELGKKGQCVVELQQIVQRYPTTKEAEIARQRLAELGLD